MGRAAVALGYIILLTGCGGGGGSAGGGTGTAPTPAPSPTPTPTPTPSPSATVSYIYTFGSKTADATQPNGPLIQAGDGNFYGTSRAGGVNLCRADRIPCGTIFRVTPSGNEAVLYSFGATSTDAYGPGAPLVQGRDGALYGTAASGGIYGAGAVFRIALDGTYSVLHSFGATPTDGATPAAGLVQGTDGNFYGTTSSGGANHCNNIPQAGGNCGTIFKMTPLGETTILYSFGASSTDGVEPLGGLLQASDGNFYGTTIDGGNNNCASGTNNCGTVFRVTPAGTVTILHSFGAGASDGLAPQGTLIQGADGALYGTTPSGGGGNCGFQYGCGTVFRVTLSGTTSTLSTFAVSSTADGHGPSPFLIQGKDGNFYGTTRSGGSYQCTSCGTAFKLSPAGMRTILFSFGPVNENPSDPGAGLTEGLDGALYGVTFSSRIATGSGNVFKLIRP